MDWNSRFKKGWSRRRAVIIAGMFVGIAAVGLVRAAFAADWPQWRGPYHTGVSQETGWQTRWPASGPRKLWTAQVGIGYSSVAVRGGRVYTTGCNGNQDTVFCLNAENGQVVWRYSYAHPRRDFSADPNPTATGSTPTLDGNAVYVLSREGVAFCINAANGRPLWQRDLRRESNAEIPNWGFTGSPLIEGNLVVFNVGANGVALNKANGSVAWKSNGGKAGYATPVSYTVGAQHGVALFTANAIVGVNPANGRPLWRYPWQTSYDVNSADPIFSGDTVFISSGYDRGCALIRMSGKPSRVWENRNMRNHINSSVLVGEYLYGNDQNTLKCMNYRTGAARWQMRGMGNGGLTAAGGNLIVITERGELLVVAATPDKFTELARAKVLGGTCWTQPVLSGGRIYCRNTGGELACLDVRAGK